MCNNYVFKPPSGDLFSQLKLGDDLTYPEGKPNLEPTEVRIGNRAPVVMRHEGAPALLMKPWAWKSPQGRPVFNFRSEGRDFGTSTRCLIPACGFFEFTDAQPGETRKTKWLFEMKDHEDFWIAGLIKQDAFSMLTCEPGPDVAPYHDRQIVLLAPDEGIGWLDLTRPQADILKPVGKGTLTVKQVYPPV